MTTKKIVRSGILIALCVVGAFLKIPSPTGTVALDSAPGFVAAAVLGGWDGALIIAIGHLVSSGIVGFPLTIPIHLLIALEMAAFAFLFALLYRKTNGYLAVIFTTLANGVLAPLTMVPFFGWGFFLGMLLPLTVASAVNVVLAFLVSKALANTGAVADVKSQG